MVSLGDELPVQEERELAVDVPGKAEVAVLGDADGIVPPEIRERRTVAESAGDAVQEMLRLDVSGFVETNLDEPGA